MWGFREQIAPDAFNETDMDDVVALFDHTGEPLGRTTNDTLELKVDKRGLLYDSQLPNTQHGRDIGTLIERGDITQSSFGFTMLPDGDEWDEKKDGTLIRTLTKIHRLYDVSPVTFPAYRQTDVSKRSLELFEAVKRRDMDGIIAATRARQITFEVTHGIKRVA
jgi:HK97 family phage prohead protease